MPSTLLTVAGLGIDVIGALVIALPDIPRLRLVLWAERVRRGLRRMESNGVSNDNVGYEEIQSLFEELYNFDFPEEVWAMRVGFHTMSRFGFESVYLFTDPKDQDEQIALGKEIGFGLDYREARSIIQSRIDDNTTKVRADGFILLASGFVMQIIGRFV